MIHTNSSSLKGEVTKCQKKVWKQLQILPQRFWTQASPAHSEDKMFASGYLEGFLRDRQLLWPPRCSLSSLTLACDFCLYSSGFYYLFCGEKKGCSGVRRSLTSLFPNSCFLLQFSTGSDTKHSENLIHM